MANLLFQNQAKWSESKPAETIFPGYAKKLRLNIETFKADRQSEDVAERIGQELQKAKSLKLNSMLPGILNGRILSFEELSNLEEIISKDNK